MFNKSKLLIISLLINYCTSSRRTDTYLGFYRFKSDKSNNIYPMALIRIKELPFEENSGKKLVVEEKSRIKLRIFGSSENTYLNRNSSTSELETNFEDSENGQKEQILSNHLKTHKNSMPNIKRKPLFSHRLTNLYEKQERSPSMSNLKDQNDCDDGLKNLGRRKYLNSRPNPESYQSSESNTVRKYITNNRFRKQQDLNHIISESHDLLPNFQSHREFSSGFEHQNSDARDESSFHINKGESERLESDESFPISRFMNFKRNRIRAKKMVLIFD